MDRARARVSRDGEQAGESIKENPDKRTEKCVCVCVHACVHDGDVGKQSSRMCVCVCIMDILAGSDSNVLDGAFLIVTQVLSNPGRKHSHLVPPLLIVCLTATVMVVSVRGGGGEESTWSGVEWRDGAWSTTAQSPSFFLLSLCVCLRVCCALCVSFCVALI